MEVLAALVLLVKEMLVEQALQQMEQMYLLLEVVEALARLEQLQLEVWVEMVVLVRHQALQEHQLLMPVAVAVVATALAPKARAALVVEVALVQQEQLALLT